uniref:Uncharacterized protein n=1 Tax=Panagrolaimus davidi TaxID=227884 RepID=A0A914PKY0_9BILA
MANDVIHDVIIQDFIRGPNYILRYEEHNLQALKYLSNTAVLKTDKNLLNNHLINYKESNAEMVVIEFKYEKKESRYTAAYPLLSLSQNLKAKVYEKYEYLDIVNRNYCILYELSKIYDIEVPAIETFVQNYKNIAEEYESINDFKSKFSKIAFHPEKHENSEEEFVRHLSNDVKSLKEKLQDEYPRFKIMQIIEICSAYIIDRIHDYLVSNEFIKRDYCAMGNNVIFFKPSKDFVKKDEIEKIQKYLYSKTGFQINLRSKE